MAKKKKNPGAGVIAANRKARHDYTILDTYETGIVLQGTEIKSLRDGKASLVEAYATIDDGEVWLRNLHIPEYSMGSWTNHSPRRTRNHMVVLAQLFRDRAADTAGRASDECLFHALIPLNFRPRSRAISRSSVRRLMAWRLS